jgi:hypothetical protein
MVTTDSALLGVSFRWLLVALVFVFLRGVGLVAGVTQGSHKQHEARTGSKVLGEWTPEVVSSEWCEIEFDASEAMVGEGVYEVKWGYPRGLSMLRVQWVALLQDGREVARETHPGRAAKSSEGNVSRLKLDALAFGAKYGFRMRFRGSGQFEKSSCPKPVGIPKVRSRNP